MSKVKRSLHSVEGKKVEGREGVGEGGGAEETAGVKQIVSLRGGDRRAHSVSFIERRGEMGRVAREELLLRQTW